MEISQLIRIRLKQNLILLQFALLLTFSGCMPRGTYSSFSVRNNTPRDLDHATLNIGPEFAFELGVIIPNTGKSFSGTIPLESSNTSTLSWFNPSGEKEVRPLVLTKSEITDKRRIKFTINGDGSVTKGCPPVTN